MENQQSKEKPFAAKVEDKVQEAKQDISEALTDDKKKAEKKEDR